MPELQYLPGLILTVLFALGAHRASESLLRNQMRWIAVIWVLTYLLDAIVLRALDQI
jgi:hypothetical protein